MCVNTHSKNKIGGYLELTLKIHRQVLWSSTSNLIIPRRCQDENGKEMYQNVKRASRARRRRRRSW